MSEINTQEILQAIDQLSQQNLELQQRLERIEQQNTEIKEQTLTNSEKIPYVITSALNQFIEQLTETMQNRKGSEMPELIQELTGALDRLYVKIHDTSLIYLDTKQTILDTRQKTSPTEPPDSLNN